MVNKEIAIPYYLQLADIIRDQINTGIFRPNDLIPSERELCEKYNISRSTVRQTIQLLKEEGLLSKEKGVGTRVKQPVFEQNLLGHHNLDLQMKEKGYQASTKILKHEELTGSSRVQRLLNLKITDRLLKITRLRIVDNCPFFIEKIYIPRSKFPDIKPDDFNDTYIFLKTIEKDYGIALGRIDVFLEPVLLNDYERHIMGIKESPAPGLLVERISNDDDGRPVALTKRVFRGDRCRHMLVIK
ncbi:GntR family transcriptional regulator [Desulforhopalus singaporensis]|uniref:GntR family transcriptional regulator n=1 Tax=Desulforhopalus singaporensis TaxID=91360 RepID=A0A1H0UEY8_9BACT|nr:GntR family transcriptional regulator [Desulforhopalus singaporensis]SDP64426.1 GntR family transcriptional regulator [Desulforhopalus singaporensis]